MPGAESRARHFFWKIRFYEKFGMGNTPFGMSGFPDGNVHRLIGFRRYMRRRDKIAR
jgi:hypothetical protein